MTPDDTRPPAAPIGAPRLGSTPGGTAVLAGRTISRIGYGGAQLARLHPDTEAATAVVRRAVQLGVNHLDTAQFYGDGFVNDVLRQVLRPGDGVLVATKVGADPDPDGPIPMRLAQRPEQLRASVEANLRTLGRDQLPLVNLRRTDGASHVRASGDQVVDLDDQLAELTALREQGKIAAIGLSSITAQGLLQAMPVGIACVQNEYSLVNRADEQVLALCTQHDIAWVPFYPLGGARPGMAKVTDQPAVRDVAQRLGVSPAQVGLAWLLHHAPNVLLIPGTADAAHLEANLAAGSVNLDAATITALDASTAAAWHERRRAAFDHSDRERTDTAPTAVREPVV